MKKPFYSFCFSSYIAITFSLFGSFLLFVVGALKALNAFQVFFLDYIPAGKEQLHPSDIGVTYLIKSLDTFLIALVLFIFAHAVYTLFISDISRTKNSGLLNWIQTLNIRHLKNVLGEVIVIILFVKFLKLVFVNIDNLRWELLILAISIALMVLELKILKLNKDDGHINKR